MPKKLISIILAFTILLSLPSFALAERKYIGDEPPDDYIVGRQGKIEDALTVQVSTLPIILESFDSDEFIWLRYPANNYQFRTAPTVDQNFFSNKMEDASTAIQDSMANIFFSFSKVAAMLANNIILLVFDNFLTDGMFKSIGTIVGALTSYENGGLFSLMLLLMMIILGIAIILHLVRAQLMRAFSSVLVAALCIACITAYSLNVDKIVPAIMNFTNQATGMALMATSYMKDIPEDEAVEIDSLVGETTLLQQGLIETTNAMWHITVGAPWANGMFGSGDPNNLKLLPSEVAAINKDINKTFSIKLLGSDGLINVDMDWEALFKNKGIPEESYMDSVWLASSNDVRQSMLQAITGTQERYESDNTAVLYTVGQGMTSSTLHMGTAILTLIPAFLFLLFSVFVGLPILVAQFILLFLLILLPFALLMGVAGEKGIQTTILYLKHLLGAAASKIIYGFYMSFVLLSTVSLTQVSFVQNNFMLSGFLISVILGLALIFRKRFFEGVIGLLSFEPPHNYGVDAKGLIKGFVAGRIIQKARKNNRINSTQTSSNPSPTYRQQDKQEGSAKSSQGPQLSNNPPPPKRNFNKPPKTTDDSSRTQGPPKRDFNEPPGIVTADDSFWRSENQEPPKRDFNEPPGIVTTDDSFWTQEPPKRDVNEPPGIVTADDSFWTQEPPKRGFNEPPGAADGSFRTNPPIPKSSPPHQTPEQKKPPTKEPPPPTKNSPES